MQIAGRKRTAEIAFDGWCHERTAHATDISRRACRFAIRVPAAGCYGRIDGEFIHRCQEFFLACTGFTQPQTQINTATVLEEVLRMCRRADLLPCINAAFAAGSGAGSIAERTIIILHIIRRAHHRDACHFCAQFPRNTPFGQ